MYAMDVPITRSTQEYLGIKVQNINYIPIKTRTGQVASTSFTVIFQG